MRVKAFYSILIFGLLCCFGRAQDCTLNIGGKDAGTIVEIFQLNEEQQSQMQTWQVALETETASIEAEIKELMDKHPQETNEELADLAKKYNVLKHKMVNTSKMYDKKLLGLFNERQYQRYVDLCKAAIRDPLVGVRND
ncbi:hypothetical protein [Spongiimicrobium sp. 3-5]|uniref:hypothetical protein n=1 Tax=Spongiimicrobium sp. 3-5 TaxID=3332596 RepID=UPI0039810FE2